MVIFWLRIFVQLTKGTYVLGSDALLGMRSLVLNPLRILCADRPAFCQSCKDSSEGFADEP